MSRPPRVTARSASVFAAGAAPSSLCLLICARSIRLFVFLLGSLYMHLYRMAVIRKANHIHGYNITKHFHVPPVVLKYFNMFFIIIHNFIRLCCQRLLFFKNLFVFSPRCYRFYAIDFSVFSMANTIYYLLIL